MKKVVGMQAFIIMQSIDGADFEQGYSIQQNKEVPFNYYKNN